MNEKLKNSQGEIFYGMHFYPGVAEYKDAPDAEPYRVFINEDTIRAMGPSFAGKPIFVDHVDEVEGNVDELRKEADGWVSESFFNAADGKNWVKFIVVSERAKRAIKKGYKLSNAYMPESYGPGGTWNGVSYLKQVVRGKYEHLAIVANPRYEESKIMTPDEFKTYNSERDLELKRLANSKDPTPKKENKTMGLSFFKKAKVENSSDFEGVSVTLPKSKKECTIEKLVNDADDMAMMDSKDMMANGEHMVEYGGKKMSLNDLLDAHKKMNDELDLLKEKKAGDKAGSKESDIESLDNEDEESDEDDKKENEEESEEDDKKKKKENGDEESDEDKKAKKNSKARIKNDDDEESEGHYRFDELDEEDDSALEAAKKAAKGRKNFEGLKNAKETVIPEAKPIVLSQDRIARGKQLF